MSLRESAPYADALDPLTVHHALSLRRGMSMMNRERNGAA
jgi:hypothetical protein